MPRNVRPAWMDIRTDGRSSTVGTGPQARTGKMNGTLSLRIDGEPTKALEMFAGGSQDMVRSFVSIDLCLAGTVTLPDGTTVALPAGSVVDVEGKQ